MGLRSVKQGSKGADVRAIQQGLNKYYQKRVVDEDGDFGGETDRVVRQFQKENDLDPDGVVGAVTRSALFPLVAVTLNFWGQRQTGGLRSKIGLGVPPLTPPSLSPPNLTPPANLVAGNAPVTNELIAYAGLSDPIPTPKVATPPAGRIVVDWQQFAQTQRQFDGLFQNPQDSFAIGLQSVFKRQQLDEDASHLEIATGCLLQSPLGFQDAHGNAFTLACFAQATWVESLGLGQNFQWAPYVQVQGQGNTSGPADAMGQVSAFPIDFNIDLGKLGFDDVSLQVGAGGMAGLKFTPQGLRSTWGPQLSFQVQGKIWFLGN